MKKLLAIAGVSLLSIIPLQTKSQDNVIKDSALINEQFKNIPTAIPSTISHSIYNKPVVKIYPETLDQGKTAFIDIKTGKELNHPYYVFNNQKYPIFKDSTNCYSGLIGTNPNQKTGESIIILKDESNTLADTIKLKINKVKFGTQTITTSKQVSSLTATSDEQAKIKAALNTKSDIKYFRDTTFQIPTIGTYKSPYGVKRIENGVYKNDFHKGLDISAPTGTPIKSMQPGKVLVAEQFKLNGGTVIVDHGRGMVSAYLHMSKICVKPGQIITLRDTIGKVGNTGHSTGPHLHFGLYVNGTAVDPLQFLNEKALKNPCLKKTANKIVKSVARRV